MRDGGLPHRKASAEAATTNLRLPRDVLEDLEAPWVGEGLCDPLELLGVHDYRGEFDMIDR